MLQVHDDIGANAAGTGHGANAYGGAQGVQIRKAVAHDIDLGRVPHQFSQRVGHDTGFDLGALFHLGAAAAVELKTQPVFDDRLVAAPGEGELYRHIRKLQRFRHGGGLLPKAHGDAGTDAVGALHLVDLLGDAEFFLPHDVHVSLFEHDEITVPVVAAEDAVEAIAPVVELILHLVPQVIPGPLRQILAKLVQIIDHNDPRDGAGLLILQADIVILRDVQPVGDAQEHIGFRSLLGADQISVDLVLLPLQLQDSGIAVFALGEPFAGKVRHQIGDTHVHAFFGHATHGEKHLIAPDDIGIVQTEHGDGQRKMLERIVLGILRIIGHRLDIGRELLFPNTAGNQRKNQQHQDHARTEGQQAVPVPSESETENAVSAPAVEAVEQPCAGQCEEGRARSVA